MISFLIVLAVACLIFWLIFTYLLPKLPEPIRTVAIVVLVIIAILWLLIFAGVLPMGGIMLRR